MQVIIIILSGLILCVNCLFASENKSQKPNILWLIAEDLGPALSCYGTKEVYTPNLDSLASKGTRYTRFYTTAPVCSPSRSAFMTGMYATTIGAHHHRSNRDGNFPLPDGVKLLTEWMRELGYFTANIVELPKECGFRGTGKTDWNFTAPAKPFDSKSWNDLKINQPFFAQINFNETHRPFKAPQKADPSKVELPPYYPDHPIAREDYAKYLDSAMELDRKIGIILDLLKRDSLDKNTIIVFFGDNGEAHVRGKQFCYEEGLHVPLIIYIPDQYLPIKNYKPASVDSRLLMAIDLAPTMIAIGGGIPPKTMQGIPFLTDRAGEPRNYVFGARDRCDETSMHIRTVRDERFRYIRNFTPEKPLLSPNAYKEKSYPMWNLIKELNLQGKLTPVQAALCAPRLPDEELYDLEKDPYQTNNLASSPDYQDVLKRMRIVLENWIKETDDKGRFPEKISEKQK